MGIKQETEGGGDYNTQDARYKTEESPRREALLFWPLESPVSAPAQIDMISSLGRERVASASHSHPLIPLLPTNCSRSVGHSCEWHRLTELGFVLGAFARRLLPLTHGQCISNGEYRPAKIVSN